MADRAQVRSIESISLFRDNLATIADEVNRTVQAVDMEIRRVERAFDSELPAYWRNVGRRAEQEMNRVRTELHRKRLQRTDGYIPDDSAEKAALRRWKAALDLSQVKLERLRKLRPELQQAIIEYHGRSRPLSDDISVNIPEALALLARMTQALEAYTSTAPPRMDSSASAEPTPPGGDSPPSA